MFERASIDEFYLDCTKVADGAFLSSCNTDAMNIKVAGIRVADALRRVMCLGCQFPKTEDDLRLVAGAAVVSTCAVRSSIASIILYRLALTHASLQLQVAE